MSRWPVEWPSRYWLLASNPATKPAVRQLIDLLFWNPPGETKEKHEQPKSQPVNRQRFESTLSRRKSLKFRIACTNEVHRSYLIARRNDMFRLSSRSSGHSYKGNLSGWSRKINYLTECVRAVSVYVTVLTVKTQTPMQYSDLVKMILFSYYLLLLFINKSKQTSHIRGI